MKDFVMLKNLIMKTNKLEISILICILLVALFLRVSGSHFGYPLLTHADEKAILQPVLHMTEKMTLDPNMYNRPDHIMIYINFFTLNIISFLKFGLFISSTFHDNEFFFYHVARIITALFGVACVFITFLIGKQFKKDFGLIAALVFAIFSSFVEHSNYVTPDVPITLFSLLIIYFSIKFLKTDRKIYLILSTLFCAVNTAEKYPGLISLIIVSTVIIIKIWPLIRKDLSCGLKELVKTHIHYGLIYLLFLFLVAPNIFIEYGQVLAAIKRESRSYHLGVENLGWFGNMLFYAKTYFNISGAILFISLIIGIIMFIKNKELFMLPLFYGFAYWFLLSKIPLHWERWALPMYITPLLISSYGIRYVYDYLISIKNKSKINLMVFYLLLFFSGITMLLECSIGIMRNSFQDTRVISLEYCNNNGISKDNSISEGYTPFIPNELVNLKFDYNMVTSRSYIILSSYIYRRYYNENERYNDQVQLYERIKKENKLIVSFKPWSYTKKLKENPVLGSMGIHLEYDRFIKSINFFNALITHQNYPPLTGPQIDIYQVESSASS